VLHFEITVKYRFPGTVQKLLQRNPSEHDGFIMTVASRFDRYVGIDYSGAAPTEVMNDSKLPEMKGHIKSLGADMRSLILTELGTNTDVTVAITPQTRIVTTTG
jgi:hypothetical protein